MNIYDPPLLEIQRRIDAAIFWEKFWGSVSVFLFLVLICIGICFVAKLCR